MWKKIFSKKKADDDQLRPETGALDRLANIDKARLPQHVAIIMDGNGRWATSKGLIRTAGHRAGVKALKNIVRACNDIGIKALTVYAFSTENWKRPHAEVSFLMDLFSEFLAKEIAEMCEENDKINFIGRIDELAEGLQKQIANARERTRDNTGIHFNVAVNYGGKDELVRAMQAVARDVKAGRLAPEDINEAVIEEQLDTRDVPPVDFVIRTSGDIRLSNFLIWQTAYAEFWFTDVNWPDFTPEHLYEALAEFCKRDRRFGGLSDKK